MLFNSKKNLKKFILPIGSPKTFFVSLVGKTRETNFLPFKTKFFAAAFIDSHFFLNIFSISLRIRIKKNIKKRIPNECGINKTQKRDKKIIVSLTSFPERINKVHITISHLLTQTLKPDKVILWLAEEQFLNKENELPDELLNLKNFGLEIKWCEDIKSYKKLIPSLKEFPNDIIITFDDDIYYDEDIIEKLYCEYLKDSKNIYANRISRIYIKNDEVKSLSFCEFYKNQEKFKSPDFKNVLTGCAGVLYPPDSLHLNVINKNEFMNLLPTHDDVWFWANAVLNNTKIKPVSLYDIELCTIEDTQQHGLCKRNNRIHGINACDAINKIIKTRPRLLQSLKGDQHA